MIIANTIIKDNTNFLWVALIKLNRQLFTKHNISY